MLFRVLSVLLLSVSLFWTESQSIHFEEDTDSEWSFRKDYKYVAESKTYYKEHDARMWSDAVATCKAEGAQLATPLTAEDAQVLARQITDSSWLGIHDLLAEGSFTTLNGTPLNDIYYNWRSGEPNDAADGEDCVVMSKDAKYSDVKCKKKIRFFCTKHLSEVKPHTVCETSDKGYFLQPEADRCYKLHTTPKNWHEAFSICHYEEATLAIINSQAEADVYVENISRYPEHTLRGNFNKKVVLLGFSDIITPGQMLTIHGQTLKETGYNEWADGQPDNKRGKEHCGSMFRDGRLNDIDCDVRAYFFCEKVLTQNMSPQLIIPRFGDKNTTSSTSATISTTTTSTTTTTTTRRAPTTSFTADDLFIFQE